MKTPAAILFLVLLTVTQTPLGQVLKLPVLIEHFYKHKKQEGVSFVNFLKNHYTAEHNDTDQSEDEQLPFKSVILHSIGSALVPGAGKTDFTCSIAPPQISTRERFSILQQHLFSIFHPPRVSVYNQPLFFFTSDSFM